MNERRKAVRRTTDMTVSKHVDGEIYFCRACEISATGIRLERIFNPDPGDRPIRIELPLVEGGLTTVLSARKVWREKPLPQVRQRKRGTGLGRQRGW